jgi:hypothetical protein
VATRFALDPDNISKGSSTPHLSRFHEEFPPTSSGVLRSKSALMSVVHRTRHSKLGKKHTIKERENRSYDGHESFDLSGPMNRLGYSMLTSVDAKASEHAPGQSVPDTPNIDPRHRPSNDAAALWERALKRRVEENAERIGKSLSLPDKGSLSSKRKGKQPSTIAPASNSGNNTEVKIRQGSRNKSATAWTVDLALQKGQAEVKRVSPLRSSPSRRGRQLNRKSPDPWARFPSHTRAIRNESATPSEKVETKDFAIKHTNTLGSVEYHQGNRKHLHHHHHQDETHREKHKSLPIRWGLSVRKHVYRLRTTKAAQLRDAFHGRRSSVSLGGHLEYPELEILGGRGLDLLGEGEELGSLQQEVDAALRMEERRKRRIVLGNGDGSGDIADDMSDSGEGSTMEIGDASFYADCVLVPVLSNNACSPLNGIEGIDTRKSERDILMEAATSEEQDTTFQAPNILAADQPANAPANKSSKFRTWSGVDLYLRGSRRGSMLSDQRSQDDAQNVSEVNPDGVWTGHGITGRSTSERDWHRCVSENIGTAVLRGSTLDFKVDLERSEVLEGERALRAAEEAWESLRT